MIIKSELGIVEINIPRDRNGEFEPPIIAKHQRNINGIENKVRDENQIVNKVAYVAIRVNMDGEKDVLGLWILGNETNKFWLSVLNDFKTRGSKNLLVLCINSLDGFSEAIAAINPASKIQRCIIHQIRLNMKYVASGYQGDYIHNKCYRDFKQSVP